jgi:hypothetical protein
MTESRSTAFHPLRSAGTPMPQFGQPSATLRQERNSALAQFESEPSGLVEWLGTREARQYEGQWVLLSDDFEVIDHAHSPTDLLRRHNDLRTPMIVFVDPPDTNLAV